MEVISQSLQEMPAHSSATAVVEVQICFDCGSMILALGFINGVLSRHSIIPMKFNDSIDARTHAGEERHNLNY